MLCMRALGAGECGARRTATGQGYLARSQALSIPP